MSTLGVRSIVALICTAATIGFAACGSDETVTETEPTSRIDLVVGDIVPLTGPGAGLGVSAQKAAQLAVEEINDAVGEAEAEHTVEIVHQDASALGARGAAKAVAEYGATCVLGPWSRRGVAAAADELDAPAGPLLVSPQAGIGRAPGALGGRPVIGMPGLGPQRTLSPENRDPDRDDPTAAFARLYTSSDPPISPALRTDARQFDAVILCYLAAVAAGDADAKTTSGTIVPAGPQKAYSWLELTDAIEALEEGERIVYAGITTRVGIQPSSAAQS